MNRRRLTLIEVLQPKSFHATPERARVTRTIVQPEIDMFEQEEAGTGNAEKSAPAVRRVPNSSSPTAALALAGV